MSQTTFTRPDLKFVISRIKIANHLATATFINLIHGADCVRVVIELQDKNSQILHLSHHPVFFEMSGPGKLIGENPFSLEAGRGAVFIQAGRESGEISLKAHVDGLPFAEIIINIIAMQEETVPVKKL